MHLQLLPATRTHQPCLRGSSLAGSCVGQESLLRKFQVNFCCSCTALRIGSQNVISCGVNPLQNHHGMETRLTVLLTAPQGPSDGPIGVIVNYEIGTAAGSR